MKKLKLFYAPGACSRVPLNALEELELAYEEHPLALLRGEQRSPDYLAINPKGKVPALQVDDRIITENPAILFYLATQYPQGRLLPDLENPESRAQGLADLAWCGSSLHPLVRQIFLPQLFTAGPPEPVRDFALQAFQPVLSQIEARLSAGEWWYGDQWSIMDVYVGWMMGLAQAAGAPGTQRPAISDFVGRVRARPSFVRALAKEEAAVQRCSIPLPPGAKL